MMCMQVINDNEIASSMVKTCQKIRYSQFADPTLKCRD